MSLIKELANESLLFIALQGCRAVIERELGIKSVEVTMSADFRQELIRRKRETQDLTFPYSYLQLASLAGERDRQSNYAVRLHGLRMPVPGDRATTTKGYLFPIALALDFHYVDSNEKQLLAMTQALVILSSIGGLNFDIKVGDMLEIAVTLEIPPDATINVADPNAPDLPGASDLNVQIIVHTRIGFFRSVSAVNGQPPNMNITVSGAETFSVELNLP